MATIASLIVDVAANTVKLQRDVEQIHGQLDKVGNIAGKLGTALAGAFTIAAVSKAANDVIDYASHVTDLSQKLGVSTSAVQKWELAFGQSGISIDTVASASTKLSKNLVDGDKSTVAALTKMGVSVAELKKLAPEQQFNTVADAVGRIQNPTEKAYAAMTVFGKGGAELLAGLDGYLTETTKKFEDMGLIINEKTIAAADDFGDQLGLMGKQLLAIIASVLGPMLPALSALGNALVAIGGIVGDLTKGFIDWSVKGLVAAWSGINRFLSSMLDAAQSIPLVGKHLGFLSGAGETLKRNAVDADRYLVELFTTTDKVGVSAKKAAPPLLGLGDAAESTGRKAAKAAEGLKLLAAHNLKLTDPDMKISGLPMVGLLGDLSEAARDHMRDLQPLDATMHDFGTVTLPNVTSSLQRTATSTASFGSTLKTNLKSSLGGLNNMFQSAFEGGGGVKGAVSSMATNLVSTVTSFIPVIGPIISKFAGPIVAGVKKLFGGVSQAELDGRKAVQGFEQQLASTLTTTQKLEAGNDQWKMTTIAVRDAYLATGRSSAEAEAAVKQLWDASKLGAEATKTAIDNINSVLSEQKQRAADVATGVNGILAAAQTFGGSVPTALKPMIEKLLEMKGLTEDQKKALQDLIDTGPDMNALEGIAKNYGITLEQLGPKFQQSHIDTLAHQYADDFNKLVDAGADVGGVITGMSPKINAVVGEALKFGTTVPEAMKPMLQKMIDLGLLVDDNGKKITDLSKFNFNDSKSPLDQAVDKFTKAIDHLGELLNGLPGIAQNSANGIAGALNSIPSRKDIDIVYHESGREIEYASRGGLVTSSGIQYFAGGGSVLPFTPRGTDTVPAMLTPGELVLNPRESRAYRAGQRGASVTDMSEFRAMRRYFETEFKQDLARAVRDEVQKVARR